MTDSAPRMRSHSEQHRHSQSVNEREIAARIMTLLSHFWTAADSPEFRKLQMADWLDDLAQFPAIHVAKACQEWRQTQTRRPTPAEILRLTREVQGAWKLAQTSQQIEYRPPRKLSPNLVRDDFRSIRMADRTAAEMAICTRELEAESTAAGFPPGLDGRLAFVKSRLKANARQQKIDLGILPAKEIPPP